MFPKSRKASDFHNYREDSAESDMIYGIWLLFSEGCILAGSGSGRDSEGVKGLWPGWFRGEIREGRVRDPLIGLGGSGSFPFFRTLHLLSLT